MSDTLLHTLIAQTPDTRLPMGKGIAMIAFFGGVAIVSTFGLFASNRLLEKMSGVIGTKKPIVARIVCGLAAFVGIMAVFVTVLALLGELD